MNSSLNFSFCVDISHLLKENDWKGNNQKESKTNNSSESRREEEMQTMSRFSFRFFDFLSPGYSHEFRISFLDFSIDFLSLSR
jgi:hypothetical protein